MITIKSLDKSHSSDVVNILIDSFSNNYDKEINESIFSSDEVDGIVAMEEGNVLGYASIHYIKKITRKSGVIEDVVDKNIELLLIKTALDCFLVLFLISSGGRGAAYSGISILLYQGFFTLLALSFGGSISTDVANAVAGVGGVLLVGVGINLLGIKKIPVGNYILSLFIPFLIAF